MRTHKFSIPAKIFMFLCALFLIFSFVIYLEPLDVNRKSKINTERAMEGRLIWQKYNCQSCHQLYGLGGYLGPDLTNVYHKFNDNSDVLRFFFKGGIKQMPKYNMSKKEEDLLIEFLKCTNASGVADPREYKELSDGMIQQNGERK